MSDKKRVEQHYVVFYENAHTTFKSICKDGDLDSKDSFFTNTFSTLEQEGIHVCSHPGISRIVEEFIDEADATCIVHLMRSFKKNWNAVITNKYTHHVLEKAMLHCQPLLSNPDVKEVCSELCEFLWSHYPEYLQHTYGSFILRTFLLLMSGVRLVKVEKREPITPQQISLCTPADEQWSARLEDLAARFLKSSTVVGLAENEQSGPFLQDLIVVVSARFPEKFDVICRFLISKSGLFDQEGSSVAVGTDNKVFPACFQHPCSSYFIEQLVALLPDKRFHKFLNLHVHGSELHLAVSSRASYILQRVLSRCTTSDEIIPLLAAVENNLEAVLLAGQHGVVLTLVQIALNWDNLQLRVMKSILTALHCSSQPESVEDSVLLTRSLSNLKPFTSTQSESSDSTIQCSLPGSLMLQTLVKYRRTGYITASFLAWPTSELIGWCCHVNACHVMEALLKSGNVPAVRKRELITKMAENTVDLACDKFGSRIMDVIHVIADLETKELVAKALVPHSNRLRNDRFGCFTYRKFAPAIYQRTPTQWLRIQKTMIDEANKEKASLKKSEETTTTGTSRKRKRNKRNKSDNSKAT